VSALRDLNGRTLDGDGDGAAGGNYVTTFKASPAPMQVSVGDVTRGPGQALNVPAAATGLPIRLAGAIPEGALAVTFELAYDPLLLEVTGAVSPAAGIAVGFTLIEPGLARIEVSIPGGLPAGGVIARLVATVPTAAPYGATHLLDVSDVRVNGAARGDDDGVHVVGYAGDATGEGVYSALDAQRILRVNTGADSGFAAWPLVDPVVVADITGDGRLTSLDAALVNLTAAGVNRPEVPVRSVPTPSLVFATFTPAADEPPPPPLFSFATVSTLEAQSAAPLTLTVEGSPSGAIERRLRTATLPTIEWKPVETVSSQRNAPRAGWLADFLGGKGFKPAKTQTWSVTAGR
jgi:hypothetical protein